MAFNSAAPLAQLVSIASGLSGVQAAQAGVPSSIDTRLEAYVILAGQRIQDKAAGGLLQREADYIVGLVYRTEGDVATAEAALAAAVDALIAAVYADRTLGGTVLSARVDLSGAGGPEYVRWAGQEFREFPALIRTTQQAIS